MHATVRAAAVIVLLLTGGVTPAGTLSRDAAASQLLALHQEVMAAHLAGDASPIVARESEDYVEAGRGEITFPTLEARDTRLSGYLKSTRFEKYEDLVEPVVQVSPDGQLGWVIAQVGAHGVRERGDGTSERVAFVCAWIELYESRDGRWFRVGNVSSFAPADSTD